MKKVFCGLSAVLLVPVLAFAGGDYGSSFSTASSVDAVANGRIGVAGDVDYFKVVISQTVDFVALTAGESDTVGVLYNSSGAILTSNDDAMGSQNFRVNYRLAPGTYYLTVRLYRSTATGDYSLRLFKSPVQTVTQDDYGNSISTATSLNASMTGQLTAGDIDYFKITTSQAGNLQVYTTGATDTLGMLYNALGQKLKENDDSDGRNFKIDYQIQSAGAYYIAVRHFNATTGAGAYGISSRFTPVVLQPPVLLAPISNVTVNKDTGTTFSWRAVAGATSYRMVISQNEQFTGYSASTGQCNSTCSLVTIPNPSYNKTSFSVAGQRYYWKVQASNVASNSSWSSTESFSTNGIRQSPAVHPLPNGRVLTNGNCQLGTPCAASGFHRGIDIMARSGSVVVAMCDGVVERNKTNKSIWNSVLIIRHNCNGHTYYGYYGHIQSNLSSQAEVKAGHSVGTVKNDGNNSHLHMGVSRSLIEQSWGYGSNKADFIDFRQLL